MNYIPIISDPLIYYSYILLGFAGFKCFRILVLFHLISEVGTFSKSSIIKGFQFVRNQLGPAWQPLNSPEDDLWLCNLGIDD